MTAGIASLLIRSSPTSCSILQSATRFAHVQALSRSTHSVAGTMLKKAVNQSQGNAPPTRNALATQLFPSSSPSAPNSDVLNQLRKPGSMSSFAASASARTAESFQIMSNKRSAGQTQSSGGSIEASKMLSLCRGSESFKQETDFVDLTVPDAQKKTQEAVFFAEDDFSDDDDLDLDYEAPSALPPSSLSAARETMAPPPAQSQLEMGIPWSSSPASHFLPPNLQSGLSEGSTATESSLKRESFRENGSSNGPIQKKAKKRTLPVSWKPKATEDEEEPWAAVLKTPAPKAQGLWDTSASAIKEQMKLLKNQRTQSKPGLPDSPEEDAESEAPLAQKALPVSLSGEQRHVLDLVVNKKASVFFTGPAGTGKSVLMRAIISDLQEKYGRNSERIAVTASTGLAACNIGGITLHSFSGEEVSAANRHTFADSRAHIS